MRIKQKKWILLIGLLPLGLMLYTFVNPFWWSYLTVSSSLQGRSLEQKHNIQIGLKLIDGVVLRPGELFSLNEKLQPYTTERGYLPENTFVGNKLVLTPGGGLCQLASNLYYGAVQLKLVTERHAHGVPILSFPPGFDAAISESGRDLRLKNPYLFPIQLKARRQGERLYISFKGIPYPLKQPVHAVTERIDQRTILVKVYDRRNQHLISEDYYQENKQENKI
jgi:vancomycin resistance protein YoaR